MTTSNRDAAKAMMSDAGVLDYPSFRGKLPPLRAEKPVLSLQLDDKARAAQVAAANANIELYCKP